MKLLVVEDEHKTADYVRQGLTEAGFVVDLARDGPDGLHLATTEHYDLIVLDVMLPGIDGRKVLQSIRATGNQVPVLFLTARSSVDDRVQGLELGADDYIAKPFSPRELVARVRTILRRSARPTAVAAPAITQPSQMPGVAAPAVTPSLWLLDEERHQIRFYGRALELSRYEYGVLRLLVQKPGRVFTRDELLQKVWGDANDSFDRTVDAHIKTLRAKLKTVAPGLEPIRTLRGTGYALNEDLPASL